MTELTALTARVQVLVPELAGAHEKWRAARRSVLITDVAAFLRDLLTYATTVSQQRDEQHEAAQSIMSDLRCELEMEKAERATTEQERDAAIASAKAAAGQWESLRELVQRLDDWR